MSWNGRIKPVLIITVFLGRLPPLGPTGVAALLFGIRNGRGPTGVAALLFAMGGGRGPTGVAALLCATGYGRWSSLAHPLGLLAGGCFGGCITMFMSGGAGAQPDEEDAEFLGGSKETLKSSSFLPLRFFS